MSLEEVHPKLSSAIPRVENAAVVMISSTKVNADWDFVFIGARLLQMLSVTRSVLRLTEYVVPW